MHLCKTSVGRLHAPKEKKNAEERPNLLISEIVRGMQIKAGSCKAPCAQLVLIG